MKQDEGQHPPGAYFRLAPEKAQASVGCTNSMKILGKLAIALLLIGVVACVVALVCTRRELRSSGQYRVTGINVGARYGTVLSTNSPGASQWCPTDWQPVEYAGRARVCREQFAFLCESLSDLSRSE
jgi:hypothetical protein